MKIVGSAILMEDEYKIFLFNSSGSIYVLIGSFIFSDIMDSGSSTKVMLVLGVIGIIFIAYAVAGYIFTFLMPYGLPAIPLWPSNLFIPIVIDSNVNLGIGAIGVCFLGAAFAVRPQIIRTDLDEDI